MVPNEAHPGAGLADSRYATEFDCPGVAPAPPICLELQDRAAHNMCCGRPRANGVPIPRHGESFQPRRCGLTPDPGPTLVRPWPDPGPTVARPWPDRGPTVARPWPDRRMALGTPIGPKALAPRHSP